MLPQYERSIERLLPEQREDFLGIFRAMDGYPVTIRLLDPPLHEFLPHGTEETARLAADMDSTVEEVEGWIERLREFNPMLGHRGCRLGITYPEIYEMQARAILEAAVAARQEGVDVRPEIMIPLVATRGELARLRSLVERVATEVLEGAEETVAFQIGTMIELPRAALTAARIAEEADFFSFGTNDLTQTTFGISRDDAGMFLDYYRQAGIVPEDPFVALDQEGVGRLVEMAVTDGRSTRPNLKCGICGEHGGEPSSVAFCHDTGLDYVSCSPYRVPVARLAAAQAALEGGSA
jgi:pyruvate,orthophosphate dikinase